MGDWASWAARCASSEAAPRLYGVVQISSGISPRAAASREVIDGASVPIRTASMAIQMISGRLRRVFKSIRAGRQ